MYDLVVTNDSALITYLRKTGIVDPGVPIKYPVKPEDVEGKHIIGQLSCGMACMAASYTEIPLYLPRELRGAKLIWEDYMRYADSPITYRVVRSMDNTDYPLSI